MKKEKVVTTWMISWRDFIAHISHSYCILSIGFCELIIIIRMHILVICSWNNNLGPYFSICGQFPDLLLISLAAHFWSTSFPLTMIILEHIWLTSSFDFLLRLCMTDESQLSLLNFLHKWSLSGYMVNSIVRDSICPLDA